MGTTLSVSDCLRGVRETVRRYLCLSPRTRITRTRGQGAQQNVTIPPDQQRLETISQKQHPTSTLSKSQEVCSHLQCWTQPICVLELPRLEVTGPDRLSNLPDELLIYLFDFLL
jgi:hypothetical protein